MNTLKKLCSLSALSLLTVSVFAADAPDITGSYQCKGFDPNATNANSNYSNPITVTKNGDAYAFQWLDSKGYPFNLGTGIINPDLHAVSLVFWDPGKTEFFGTALYEVKSDGTLEGKWIVKGTNQIGTETCTKK